MGADERLGLDPGDLSVPHARDAAKAVELARRAVGECRVNRPTITRWAWPSTAPAGWKAAVEVLSESIELGEGGNAYDWIFFLAMAHWQLGDRVQARTWYDKAVDWMDKNRPQDDELKRFRARPRPCCALTSPRSPTTGRHRPRKRTSAGRRREIDHRPCSTERRR